MSHMAWVPRKSSSIPWNWQQKSNLEILVLSSHKSSKISPWGLPEHCLLGSYLKSKCFLEKGRKVPKLLMKVRFYKARGLEMEGSWRKRREEMWTEEKGQKGPQRMLKARIQDATVTRGWSCLECKLKSFWKTFWSTTGKERKGERAEGEGRGEERRNRLTNTLIRKKHKDLDWAPSHTHPTTSLPVRENFLRKCTCN